MEPERKFSIAIEPDPIPMPNWEEAEDVVDNAFVYESPEPVVQRQPSPLPSPSPPISLPKTFVCRWLQVD
jgi:hypothetical protein